MEADIRSLCTAMAPQAAVTLYSPRKLTLIYTEVHNAPLHDLQQHMRGLTMASLLTFFVNF